LVLRQFALRARNPKCRLFSPLEGFAIASLTGSTLTTFLDIVLVSVLLRKPCEEMASFNDVKIDESELVNGFSAEEIFSNPECLGITFDDLIALPGSIDFGVHEVDLHTNITRKIKLSAPLCSTPMDTVTEHDMAIGMALNGGMGFIHCNCTVERQVEMISKVKNFENGFILEPAVLPPNATVKDLDDLRARKKISGVPVTVDGKMGSKLVGLISHRDTDFLEDRSMQISQLMTPMDKLVTGRHPISIAEANTILKVIIFSFFLFKFLLIFKYLRRFSPL
jgi:IMP dehydrogenase